MRIAEEEKAEMIVMGTRGLGKVAVFSSNDHNDIRDFHNKNFWHILRDSLIIIFFIFIRISLNVIITVIFIYHTTPIKRNVNCE